MTARIKPYDRHTTGHTVHTKKRRPPLPHPKPRTGVRRFPIKSVSTGSWHRGQASEVCQATADTGRARWRPAHKATAPSGLDVKTARLFECDADILHRKRRGDQIESRGRHSSLYFSKGFGPGLLERGTGGSEMPQAILTFTHSVHPSSKHWPQRAERQAALGEDAGGVLRFPRSQSDAHFPCDTWRASLLQVIVRVQPHFHTQLPQRALTIPRAPIGRHSRPFVPALL